MTTTDVTTNSVDFFTIKKRPNFSVRDTFKVRFLILKPHNTSWKKMPASVIETIYSIPRLRKCFTKPL